jgi:YD repeat-containing protein
MKKTIVFAALGIFSASILFAADDAKADVKAAAKKIGDKNNYSWTSTTKMDGAGGGGGGGRGFGGGPTDGQFADGIIYLKSTFGDRTMHTAAKGEKVIFKGEDEWDVADDGAQGPGAFAARRMRTFKAPAAEAADLVDKAQSLKSADGVISGDLTEAGAKSFLTFGGRRQNADAPAPKDAKGSVKFWVKDGELTKYEYNVQGKITGREDTEIPINRTTTVEIKDAGKTKLTLPDEAKKKF